MRHPPGLRADALPREKRASVRRAFIRRRSASGRRVRPKRSKCAWCRATWTRG
jgi:hypothetical protein